MLYPIELGVQFLRTTIHRYSPRSKRSLRNPLSSTSNCSDSIFQPIPSLPLHIAETSKLLSASDSRASPASGSAAASLLSDARGQTTAPFTTLPTESEGSMFFPGFVTSTGAYSLQQDHNLVVRRQQQVSPQIQTQIATGC